MTPKTTYAKKLLDPRWQKKRLEILNRDEWMCQRCGSETRTLHIHHIHYESCDPWETDNKFLITICETCHQHETELIKTIPVPFLKVFLKLGFSAMDLNWYTENGFDTVKLLHVPDVVLSAWFNALSDEKIQRYIIDQYLKSEQDDIDQFIKNRNSEVI